MKILLLGGSGLLGHNVLITLLKRGYEVVVLLRKEAELAIDITSTPKLRIIRGSALRIEDLRLAATDCQAIINCIGTTDMSLLGLKDYMPANAILCNSLIEVMKYHGISTLVHISTANTIGYGDKTRLADETEPIQWPFSQSYYAISKQKGEEILTKVAREERITQKSENHIIIVNPGFIIGAYDVRPSSGKLLSAAYRRSIMIAPNGGKSFISAEVCANAIVNALNCGENGERYLLTGHNISIKELYYIESKTYKYKQKIVTVPNWVMQLVGSIGDIFRKVGIGVSFSSNNCAQLSVLEFYDNSKARRELQMGTKDIESTIHEYIDWKQSSARKRKIEEM